MKTAAEAREVSRAAHAKKKAAVTEAALKALEKVSERVEANAADGGYSAVVTFSDLKDDVINELRLRLLELGYEFMAQNPDKEQLWEITVSWANADAKKMMAAAEASLVSARWTP